MVIVVPRSVRRSVRLRSVRPVRLRVPQIEAALARQVAAAVEGLRELHLYKPPGVAETIDWATALGRLGASTLDETVVANTLGTVIKYREDHMRVEQHGVDELVRQAIGTAASRADVPGQLSITDT